MNCSNPLTSAPPDDSQRASEGQAEQIRNANACVLTGAGIGALGAGAALLTGAVCPLCVVISPALISVGLARRLQLKLASGNKDKLPRTKRA